VHVMGSDGGPRKMTAKKQGEAEENEQVGNGATAQRVGSSSSSRGRAETAGQARPGRARRGDGGADGGVDSGSQGSHEARRGEARRDDVMAPVT
jgi:hypothetical protein